MPSPRSSKNIEDKIPPIWRYRARCEWLRVRWQHLAREWILVENIDRAQLCQALADWWAQPIWWQIVRALEISKLDRQLRTPPTRNGEP